MNHISGRLTGLNIIFTESGFTETDGYHSYSSYIEAVIPGESDDSLITVIPVGNDYNAAAGLALARHFSRIKPELSLKFIFLGAEDGGSENPGTRNFLEHFYPETQAAFLYFNFTGIPEAVKIISGADGFSSPFYLFDAVKDSLEGADIPWSHSATESVLFRLSAAGTESRIREYLAEGYPAIELDSSGETGTVSDIPVSDADLIEFYNGLMKRFPEGLPTEWDSHYLFFMNEQLYILIYLTVLSLLMIYPIFRRRHFGWYMQTLARNFWSPPLLFAFVFIFLSFSSFLLSFILIQAGFPEMWKYCPLPVFLFKISSTLLIYTLSFRLIKKLPFSKRGSFYSISAILFLVITLFILSWIDLSLSLLALWPLCFIFLFTILRKPVLKFLMLAVSVIWVFFSVYEIFTIPSFRAVEMLTVSPLKGNLLISLIILPFILAAIRLDLLSPPSRKLTRFLAPLLTLTTATLLGIIVFYSPFNEQNPQPVFIHEKLALNNGDSLYTIESPKRLSPGIEQQLSSGNRTLENSSAIMTLTTDSNPFLNRKIISIKIDFSEAPEKVRLRAFSEEPLVLYESSFPAEWSPAKKTLEVYIGQNPPVPLEISLTLNRDASAVITAEADFPAATSVEVIEDNIYSLKRQLTVIRTLDSDEQ